MNLDKLRECIKSGKYDWRKHTLRRLAERGISQKVAIEVIIKGKIIEDYPGNKPFASCLMLGWVEGKPFHVVASLDEKLDMAYIITV